MPSNGSSVEVKNAPSPVGTIDVYFTGSSSSPFSSIMPHRPFFTVISAPS